jgi:ribosomal protein L29
MSTDFKQMNTDDLQKTLTEKREKLLTNRFALSGGQSRKNTAARILKREIAQILTMLGATK